MIVMLLLSCLGIVALVFTVVLIRTAMARHELRPSLEAAGLGAVTNFFDALGIGSFAPSTAWIKLRRLVPDSFIPATLNVGHALPTVAQALVFINSRQGRPEAARILHSRGRCRRRPGRADRGAAPGEGCAGRRRPRHADRRRALRHDQPRPHAGRRDGADARTDAVRHRRRGLFRAGRADDGGHRSLRAVPDHAQPDGPRSQGGVSGDDGRLRLS